MATDSWSTWAQWNESINQTLTDAQRKHAGDESVDTLRHKAGDGGTNSVLDVYGVAKANARGLCWVLSAAELNKFFGSKTPHKKAIEGGVEKFLSKLGKGEAIAVTAFLKGKPSAVLFAGWSAD